MKRADPLRRFTPTPHGVELPVMGHSLRLETNSQRILEHAVDLFSMYPGARSQCSEFLWRIVSQSHPPMHPPWPQRSAFSDDGLRYIEFGQRNFLAVDLDAREGVAFLTEGLVEDELGLTSPFLDNLFCMTAASLGLTAVSAACVGLGEEGLLVMGSPNSGKTTASYIAAKNGLEFHADRALFIERKEASLQAWGDFWPAAFRPETLHFLPELQASARLFRYGDFQFYYLNKRAFQNAQTHPIVPVCCVFLDRQATPIFRLSAVPRAEFSRRVAGLAAFQDDARFESQRAAVFGALGELPAYDLTYSGDPAIAARLFPGLLRKHSDRQRGGLGSAGGVQPGGIQEDVK
ncbi:MAG: hypothetical protein LAO09_13285 [Acidobacteriia bacterium]|nr:hypothetical protein [Terriglobia bacterium]